MSTLKTNSVQIGQSATATQNFTLAVPTTPNGTMKLSRGNSGATTADIFSVGSTGVISGATLSGAIIDSSTFNGGCITAGVGQNLSSSTYHDFSGIPNWVKKVTIMFSGVRLSGTDNIIIILGTSSGLSNNGYSGSVAYGTSGGTWNISSHSTGFKLDNFASASNIRHGTATICKLGPPYTYGTRYTFNSSIGLSDSAVVGVGAGSTDLGGVLDRIRITTTGFQASTGSQTFNAGNIHVMYEG
jgi:hypothetical protein